ncbi:MAG: hypothetical protein OEY33_00445, partial [Bdellovibrionales bacterium]|nr:hypothetical protein [Bdellovibrionales bacterium]
PEFEGLQITKIKQSESDQALKNLEDFFTKKLEKSLYGDVKKGVPGLVDHKVFHDLYEKQVGKNIISGISSYCIEASRSRAYILFKDENTNLKIKKENLNNLSQYKEKINQAYEDWSVCMNVLQYICHAGEYKDKEGKIIYDYKGLGKTPPQVRIQTIPSPLIFSLDDVEYSRQRTCTLIRFIKDSRQTLIKVAKIKKLLANLADPKTSIDLNNPNLISLDFSEERSLDRILQTSSKEFLYGGDKKSFKSANDALINTFKNDCVDNGINIDKCKRHFINHTEAEKMAAEVTLKTQAMVKKLEKHRHDKEKLETYLREEGYNKNEIQDILKDSDAFTRIIENYRTERKYFIERLSNRINETSLPQDKEGNIDFDAQTTKERIASIQKEIESRSENFEQLIHYNNIIEGHLGLKDEQGKEIDEKNLAILFKEVNDRISDPEEKKEYSIKIDQIKELHSKLIEKGIYKNEAPPIIETIPVELLNAQVLSYGTPETYLKDEILN